MQDLIDKLQSKVKSYKRQFEEAVSACPHHCSPGAEDKCWPSPGLPEMAARERGHEVGMGSSQPGVLAVPQTSTSPHPI